jgi:hypothetical protein
MTTASRQRRKGNSLSHVELVRTRGLICLNTGGNCQTRELFLSPFCFDLAQTHQVEIYVLAGV